MDFLAYTKRSEIKHWQSSMQQTRYRFTGKWACKHKLTDPVLALGRVTERICAWLAVSKNVPALDGAGEKTDRDPVINARCPMSLIARATRGSNQRPKHVLPRLVAAASQS